MVPNGLAAGGLTGLATIIAELGRRVGLNLPVGLQTIVMNALLILVVVRSGGLKYVVQTITGFVLFGFFTDLFVPFVLHVDHKRPERPRPCGAVSSRASATAWCFAAARHWRLGHHRPDHRTQEPAAGGRHGDGDRRGGVRRLRPCALALRTHCTRRSPWWSWAMWWTWW